ncbi:MAG: hypothetical protein HN435_02480, partial [Nitrospinaceae bacterium]|nr:hypothetical protein [Nitrospinaceae bacterium]
AFTGISIDLTNHALTSSAYEWSAFQRSGSLIVIIAILFAYASIHNWLLSYKAQINDYFESNLSILGEIVREKIHIPEDKFDKVVEDTENKLRDEWKDFQPYLGDMLNASKRLFYRIEFLLLIAGTFIWGFGDLTPCLLRIISS